MPGRDSAMPSRNIVGAVGAYANGVLAPEVGPAHSPWSIMNASYTGSIGLASST
jgi:hypothetical protein